MTKDEDIVGWLRDTFSLWNNTPSESLPTGAGVVLKAAAEIERLRAERDEARLEWGTHVENAGKWQRRAEAAKASLARAVEVMNPLLPAWLDNAVLSDSIEVNYSIVGTGWSHYATVGEFRAARAFIEQEKDDQ